MRLLFELMGGRAADTFTGDLSLTSKMIYSDL
jgi:hypothetical protein